MYWYPDECSDEKLKRIGKQADNVFLISALGLYAIKVVVVYFGFTGLSWLIAIPLFAFFSLCLRLAKVSSTRVREAIKSYNASNKPVVFGLEEETISLERVRINISPFKDVRVILLSYIAVTVIITFWYSLGRLIAFLLERI